MVMRGRVSKGIHNELHKLVKIYKSIKLFFNMPFSSSSHCWAGTGTPLDWKIIIHDRRREKSTVSLLLPLEDVEFS